MWSRVKLALQSGTLTAFFTLGNLAAAPASRNYTVLIAGHRAGNAVIQQIDRLDFRCSYQFTDRGRGPQLEALYRLDMGGYPVSVQIRGTDYYKKRVDESFNWASGRATWKNAAENQNASVGGDRFYLAWEELPVQSEIFARALLRSPQAGLELLPSGHAKIEQLARADLRHSGNEVSVELYSVSGPGLAPDYLWLDSNRRLFAHFGAWSSLVLDGWEEAASSLMASQNQEAAKYFSRMTEVVERPAAIAFVHANLFDSESGRVVPDQTVVARGNRIVSVGASPQIKVPSDALIIDARAKTLLPGLWDMHVHLQEDIDGPLDILCGVTTVRDLGNDIDDLARRADSFDSGAAVGPHVIRAGLIDGRGPYQGMTKVFADSKAEAEAAVDRYARLGYEQIKIYNSVKPELVPVIASRAHILGLRVSGHIPAFMNAEQAIHDGYDEIQHINFLFLNFWFDTVKDTRTPSRFTEVGKHAGELDLQSTRVQNFIQLLKEKRIVIDPTLGIFEAMFTGVPGEVGAAWQPVADRLPPQIKRSLLGGPGLPIPPDEVSRYRKSFRATLRMVRLLYESGVRIVAGTDDFAGFTLHRELEIYAKAGIPTAAILQLATIGAARIMKHDRETGSIQPNKVADMILVDGDPTRDISQIRRVSMVVRGGRLVKTAELAKALNIGPLP